MRKLKKAFVNEFDNVVNNIESSLIKEIKGQKFKTYGSTGEMKEPAMHVISKHSVKIKNKTKKEFTIP